MIEDEGKTSVHTAESFRPERLIDWDLDRIWNDLDFEGSAHSLNRAT